MQAKFGTEYIYFFAGGQLQNMEEEVMPTEWKLIKSHDLHSKKKKSHDLLKGRGGSL